MSYQTTHQAARQASAFGFAALVTLAMLVATQALATLPHSDLAIAAARAPASAAAASQVVVVGEHSARS